jgi:toxin ParE1/3/4
MRRILRTVEAEEDLIGIWFHIAKDNPEAADSILRRIENKVVMLAGNPSSVK